MTRKYLNDIGVDDSLMNLAETVEPDDSRWAMWDDEKEKYGFASYETWNMDTAFYGWLYEHLKMFLAIAEDVVDLNYHKFTFNDKEYTQKELINKMIHGCEIAIKKDWYNMTEDECYEVENVSKIWSIVINSMWW